MPRPQPIAEPALPPPPVVAENIEVVSPDEARFARGARAYRVRGLARALSAEALKVTLRLSLGERLHVDTLDLYQARGRAAFAKAAAVELGVSESVIAGDLSALVLALEPVQDAAIRCALQPDATEPEVVLTAEQEAAGLALLRDPHLVERIAADVDAIGVVGEGTNALVGYLAMVSRLLDKPLAILIQSTSAAGKSTLMDALLSLLPESQRVHYSAMTGQSLFYLGEGDLRHKVLAIAEEEGVRQAAYALKLLQSQGELTIASTGKDPATGKLVTSEYRVEGPVMLCLTTTAIDIDEELLNRCLVLTVNESREQTRAIHALQRSRQTLEGLLADEGRDDIVRLHRNAQRLLQPLAVVNPYADRLTFLDDKTRTRRDHMKYLSLIRAIALLHQCQREVKTVQHKGKAVRYIEVTPADIATANRLAHEVLGRTLDELPPQTRRLLTALHAWVSDECQRQAIKRCDLRFTRRQVRELTGWGDTQLKVHLGRLGELEYVLAHRTQRGQALEYELLYDGEGDAGGRFLMGLAELTQDYDAEWSGQNEDRSAPGRGVVGGRSAGGRGEPIERSASNGAACEAIEGAEATNARSEPHASSRSYPQLPSLAAVAAVA